MSKNNSDSRIASLKQHNNEYNEMFRNWRIEHKQDFGFYFQGHNDELTYRDGEGFITDYPEAQERSALNEINTVIVRTILIYLLLRALTSFCFSNWSNTFGLDVFYNPYGFFYGDETMALVLGYIILTVTRIVPMFYLLRKVKLPAKLIFNFRITNKPLFAAAIPMGMLIFAINIVFSGLGVAPASFIGIDISNQIWIPRGPEARFFASVLYTIIIPIIGEVVYRGIFLQITRQFGDGYALIITSLISALVIGGTNTWIFTLIYSFILGYFTLRTGSVATAIVMRLVISISSYWMTFMEQSVTSVDFFITASMIIVFVYMIIGLTGLIGFIKNHSNKINLPFYTMYISQQEKIMIFLSNPLTILWVAMMISVSVFEMSLLK